MGLCDLGGQVLVTEVCTTWKQERVSQETSLEQTGASIDCIYQPWSKASDWFCIKLARGQSRVSHGFADQPWRPGGKFSGKVIGCRWLSSDHVREGISLGEELRDQASVMLWRCAASPQHHPTAPGTLVPLSSICAFTHTVPSAWKALLYLVLRQAHSDDGAHIQWPSSRKLSLGSA